MREVVGEVDQPLRIRAVEPVDGLVVVAHTEHTTVGPGQEPYEQEVCRSQVLELVDEQHPARTLRGNARSGIGEQDLDCSHDLLVVVERTTVAQCPPVQRQHGHESVDVAVVQRFDLLRITKSQPGQRQGLDPQRDRVRVPLARELDQLADDPAHIGLGDGRHPGRLGCERRRPVDDGKRNCVERAHLQPR